MQFIQIAVSIVVARLAGPTVLGTVAFGLAFVSIFAFIADLGTGPAHIKLISEGRDMGKCVATFAVIRVFLVILYVIAVLTVFFVQKYVLKIEFESAAHQYVIIIFLAAVTIQQLLGIPKITFAARTEQAKYNMPDVARIFSTQLLRVIAVALGFGAVALASARLVSTIAVIPLLIFLFKGYPFSSFDKVLAKQYLKISIPVMVMGITTTVASYLDRVVLQYYADSAHVGYYAAGYKIGSLIFMVASSVGLLFFPLFSKAASNGNFTYIKNIVGKFERFSFLFIMPLVIFLALYSDVIVKVLLGNQYISSIPVMAIINVAMFLAVLNVPYGNVVTGMGYFRLAAALHVIHLITFVLLIVILINPTTFGLGATGVALALLGSNFLLGCLFRYFAKLKCAALNLTTSLRFIIFGVVNFVVFHFIYSHFSYLFGGRIKITFILLYFCITYTALLLLGWIKKDDVLNLRAIVNIRKMKQYVTEEFRGK